MGANEKVDAYVHITRNIRTSQFLGDETPTMGTSEEIPVQTMREHPLPVTKRKRER